MREFSYKDGALWCEGLAVEEAALRFGTPLYVYSRGSITDHCRWMERAFGNVEHLSCYAVKANANPAILRILASEGIGADVGSEGELSLALAAGFSPSRVTFSGVGKGDGEIQAALRAGILALNAESVEEIRVVSGIAARCGATARLCIRVNFDIPAGAHPYISTGTRRNKFGIERSRALEAFRLCRELPNLEVLGVHSHVGSQITDASAFIDTAGELAAFVGTLRGEGFSVRHLNFGGGFGVQYRNYLRHPLLPAEEEEDDRNLTTATLLESALPLLRDTGCTILIQPGRSIVAHAGILVTKVLYRKESGGKTFLIVDAGMNDLLRPALYRSYHQIAPLRLEKRESEVVDVVGPLCESGDYLALDRRLPVAARGEYLAVMCAGAYGYVLSSNYNGRPRPAEVLVDGSGCELVRPREAV